MSLKRNLLYIICTFLILNSVFAQKISTYSKELDCEDPWIYDVRHRLDDASSNIDLTAYKTIIRNGEFSFFDNPYLWDIQLGALSNTELKLFRNMIYAIKGYEFSDEELTVFFKQFVWYNPKTKKVDLSDREKSSVEAIKLFESDGNYEFNYSDKDIVIKQFGWGADQHGFYLYLNKDKTFEYIPREGCNRLKKFSGTWTVSNCNLYLMVKNETVMFGGFIQFDPTTPDIKNGIEAVINYPTPVEIRLPLNTTDVDKKYNFSSIYPWIMVGSSVCNIYEE